MGLSFDTISSTGANAAIIHYKPEPGHCSIIDPAAIYLCDSGGQYLDGTTDTTRTLHFTEPTEMQRKAYTLVLKGNIALDSAVFPAGVNGLSLDVLARQFLWKEGLDYRHGTGHGVGSYLVCDIILNHLESATKFNLECPRRSDRNRNSDSICRSRSCSGTCSLQRRVASLSDDRSRFVLI